MPPRLLIVSNRLPITVARSAHGPEVQPSVGGLATGLRAPHERSDGLWIGWPGDLSDLSADERVDVDRQLAAHRTVAVTMSAREHEVFYERICNGVLWPLCHDRLDHLPLRVEGWEAYEAMNRRFADAVVAHYRPGDVIWVHDYQLLRMPALLRERLPEARIGFFLHIPFPNPEIFFTLPVRAWLVEGMMGADLVGFHTRRYRGHFTAALRRLFGLEMGADGIVAWRGRSVRLGIHPMSVDAASFAAAATQPAIVRERDALRSGVDRLLLGIDRLDYSKGIPRRLVAFEQLLRAHPEWHGRVRLVQCAVPSRGGVGAYARFRTEVNALVGRINGDLGTATWTPVHYLHRSLPFETLVALYRAADVMLVTPVRDGMNLVAKEFVASRIDDDGVLVLSEFAGAADELSAALIVNPYDVDGVSEAIHRALLMEPEERRARMRALRVQVAAHDVHAWTEGFLSALAAMGPGPEDPTTPPTIPDRHATHT
jgi:trehalose 6-phosphate synthase/phosphatase